MEPLRKRVLGYHPAQVDIVIKELNDEIVSLRREILSFDKKVESNDDSAVVAQLVGEIKVLREELGRYESQGAEAHMASVDSSVSQIGDESLHSEVVRRQAAKIEELASTISEMDVVMAEKDAIISSFNSKLSEIAEQYNATIVRHRTPDMHVINRLYNHALDGAKDITVEARECVSEMVGRVHEELRNNAQETASLYGELVTAKQEMSAFVAQGMGHLKTLEKMLNNISDVDLKTPEIFNSLEASSEKIVEDMSTNLLTFNMDLDTELKTAVDLQFAFSPNTSAEVSIAAETTTAEETTTVATTGIEDGGENENSKNWGNSENENSKPVISEVETDESGETSDVRYDLVTADDDSDDDDATSVKPAVNIQDIFKKYSNVNS